MLRNSKEPELLKESEPRGENQEMDLESLEQEDYVEPGGHCEDLTFTVCEIGNQWKAFSRGVT